MEEREREKGEAMLVVPMAVRLMKHSKQQTSSKDRWEERKRERKNRQSNKVTQSHSEMVITTSRLLLKLL